MNKKRRPDRGPVAVRCNVCGWVGAGSTWRLAKRALAAHQDAHAKGLAA